MQVLELADEFNLTSVEAAEICVAAGVVDATALTDLTDDQAERWRTLATARREWLAHDRATAPDGTVAPSAFGPLPPAPWERGSDDAGPPADGPPWARPRPAPTLGPDPGSAGPAPALSPYAAGALALAVVSIVFPFIPGFGALALAWYAKDRIERSDGRQRGHRLATAAQVVAGLSIAGWAALLALTIVADVRSTSAPDDGQVEIGQVAWDQIGPGQCVRLPRADLAVADWTGLDCNEPHEAEVYATAVVAPTTDPNEPYPGRESLIPGATRLCEERFASYVGVPYAESDLRIAVYFPSGTNWTANDDRTLGCIVFREDYALIDGTLAQSGT